MKAIDIINYIPRERLEALALETDVDFKAKKLNGITLFQLILYSMITVKHNSLRVMEEIFNSYTFQKIKTHSKHPTIKYNSISDRFRSMDSVFFERIYDDCCQRFHTHFSDSNILRFDSTLISISSKLIDYGFRSGGHKGIKKQIKFTLGLTSIPIYKNFFFDSKYNSEEIALKEAILNCKESKEKIVVFDKGIQARATYEEFSNQNIEFVSRLKSTAKRNVLKNFLVTKNQEDDKIKIIQDAQIELFGKNHQTTKSFLRMIVALNKETNTEIIFLTNIEQLQAIEIANVYKKRWDIEVFFKFLKQELNLSHLISRDINGIKITLYLTLILAILLTVYKETNNLKGYKIPKLKFSQEIEYELMKQVVILCGGDPSKIP